MIRPRLVALEPRKFPVQARSNASVRSILEATIQVLLAVGKERLTTTRVAARAGVSVGTLYQYFPNKVSLLQAALRMHLESVEAALEQAASQAAGASLEEMVTAIAKAFLAAKMKDVETSVALYAVSADVDGIRIARETGRRASQALVSALGSAREPLAKDAQLVATVIQAAMSGMSRSLLESPSPAKRYPAHLEELVAMLRSYIRTCRSSGPADEAPLAPRWAAEEEINERECRPSRSRPAPEDRRR